MAGDNRLLRQAGRFHGHIGPFLAIGLRMGLLANETLGRDPMHTKARVKTVPGPPRSCVVDGIQFSSGCTMGKGNVEIDPDEKSVSATFTREGRSVTVILRQEFLAGMEDRLRNAPEKAVVDYSYLIMDTSAEEIFEVRQ
jgi:formylmethanofuran dehydrogenase subunit E